MKGVQSGNGKGWHPFESGIDSVLSGAGPIPKSAYVAWYKMNEGTGTTFVDSIAANNATVTGSGSWVSHTYTFNDSGYATAASAGATNFNGSTPFSFSAWFDLTGSLSDLVLYSNIENDTTFQGILASFNNNGTNWYFSWQLIDQNSGQIWLTSNIITAPAVHNITVTYDGSKTVAGTLVYLDGTVIPMFTQQSGLTGTSASGYPLSIGGWTYSAANNWVGTIQDIRVFNTVLNQTQITYLYNGGPK